MCLGLSLIITLFPKGSSRGEKLRFADGEEKLLYMMAAEISPEYEMETLKMQAVIDRTRCRKAQEDHISYASPFQSICGVTAENVQPPSARMSTPVM